MHTSTTKFLHLQVRVDVKPCLSCRRVESTLVVVATDKRSTGCGVTVAASVGLANGELGSPNGETMGGFLPVMREVAVGCVRGGPHC
jgi:hypothetical protein